MQDNSKYNYDPELVDRGWSLLEKQLDEVLPQKTKRRFAWFWLPLLLGFSLLLGGGWYVFTQDKTVKSGQLVLPVAEAEAKEQPTNAEWSTPSRPATVETKMPASSSTEKEEQPITETPIVNQQSPVALVDESISPQTIETNSHPSFDRFTDNTNELPTNADNSSLVIVEEPLVEPVITFYLPATDPDYVGISNQLSTLPLPFAQLSSTTAVEEMALPPSVSPQVKNNNWHFYTEGQLTVAIGEQAGLLGLAAGVERRLGKSWNLGLGLAYERSQQELSTKKLTYTPSQEEAAFVNSSYTEGTYNINQAYEALSYDRFKGELQLSYQLAPRWRIGTGVSLAYYRQAVFNQQSLGSFDVTHGGTSSPNDLNGERFDLFADTVSVYEYDSANNAAIGPYLLSPNRWQWAGMLSTQYQISQQWAANLNYRHNLTKWQSSNTDFGTPSFVQFGLRYYFK